MESARVRYLRASCWRIRKRTSERSERVSFLIQKQRVRKYRTKHFPCCNLFILYLLRFWIDWMKRLFPRVRKSIRDCDWMKKIRYEFFMRSILSENLSKYEINRRSALQ